MNGNARVQILGLALVAVIAVAAVGALFLQLGQARSGPSSVGPVTAAAAVSPERDTLTVVGQGQAAAAPDQARLSLAVSPTRGNVHDATAAAADEMNKLLGALHGQGVDDKDIQTETVNVQQQLNCCPQVVTGYTATTTVSVLVHHLANVGGVIGATVDAVGNDIRLQGTSLSISDSSAALKSARSAALSDAAARAADWANQSKHHVGKILAVSEITSGQPVPACQGGCGGGGIPISAGQSTVSVSVTVVYELQE